MAVHAETILRNGTVWCGRADGVAQAVALWGGRVLATGSDGDIAPLIGPDTRVIDLRGRLATPGLIDAHLHLLPYGLGMLEVDVRPHHAPTLDDLLGRIKARAEALGPGKWVLARGYDQFKLDVKRHPWREELDRVAPDNPVYLVRTCGHISICNTKAFELAGVTAATPSPPGGLIEVQNGQLTGMLAEYGRDPIRKVLPARDGRAVGRRDRARRANISTRSASPAAWTRRSACTATSARSAHISRPSAAAGCRCAPICACSAIPGRRAS